MAKPGRCHHWSSGKGAYAGNKVNQHCLRLCSGKLRRVGHLPCMLNGKPLKIVDLYQAKPGDFVDNPSRNDRFYEHQTLCFHAFPC
jgi:hypothetical protein